MKTEDELPECPAAAALSVLFGEEPTDREEAAENEKAPEGSGSRRGNGVKTAEPEGAIGKEAAKEAGSRQTFQPMGVEKSAFLWYPISIIASMKANGFLRSRMRESRTCGSVRGGYRKVSVCSIKRGTKE